MKAKWIFVLLLIGEVLSMPMKNNVVYEIGTPDSNEQIYFYTDPSDPNHRSDRIFIGCDSNHFFLVEVQYDVTLADICKYWLTDESFADFNGDDIVNFIDYAILLK